MSTFTIDENLPEFGPAAPVNIELCDEDKFFYNELEVLCTDMRSFIMSMYKFFCDNYESDCTGVSDVIAEIDNTAQTILNELIIQQINIDDQREATISDDDYDDYAESTAFSIFEDDLTSDENQDIFNLTKTRLSKMNINQRHANSLIEGLKNVQQTEKNLRRFKNINSDTLEDIFDDDDDDYIE